MNGKFTKNLLTFIFVFSLGFFMNSSMVSAQNCDVPVGLNTSSISNFSATLNWDLDANVDHYRLRYKENGSSSWLYEHNATGVSFDVASLNQLSTYIWQAKAFCSSGSVPTSTWSVVDTFVTANYPVDCNNTPNGTAFTDSCGNCVGGTTGDVACIDFTPSVNITLSTTECNVLSDITFVTSQDANEPDISSSIFSSDAGFFNFTGLNSNDVIGSADFIAGGGYINVNTTLMVDFIITSDKISVKAVDNATSQIYGSFTIENASGGILVVATSAPDNNNVTSGNSQTILLNGLFTNPDASVLNFTSIINSELGDVDNQSSIETIECLDCDGVLGGTSFTDSCGNCVGGSTGNVACIPFSPTVSVSLSNTDCDSLSDLSISVSQDPNEPDMATSLFTSDAGSFAISSMNVNDIIGSATMSVNGGNNTFNTNLIVTTIISANQVVIQSQDVNTGLILGSFTISNLNPGVSISTQSPPDNNNVTSGNAQTVIFNNVFVNSGAGVLTFTTTINSEISDQDVQNFPFTIVCLCTPNSSTDVVVACDSYTWIDGVTYTSSNNTATQTLTNAGGCDSVVTLNLTINGSTTSSVSVTECDTYTWNGTTYTSSGSYDYVTVNSNGCDSTATLNLTINGSTTSSVSVTECDTYTWNGTTYTSSGSYDYVTVNSNGCDSTATLNLTINGSTTSSVSVTECDTYTWNGTTYTSSGSYDYVTVNSNGCDSTATLNLTINGSTTSSVSVTECDTYTWNGTTYTSSGSYDYVTVNSNGCDSTATLNLTINGSTTSSVSVTECDTYTWNGTTYTSSGSYDYVTVNSNGCDSTATLNLTINGSTTSSVSVTECDTYTWNGTTYTSSGSYDYVTVNSNGCDSTATLNLTINGSTTSSVSVTECDTYTWNGTTYTSSGSYDYVTVNSNGCDSTATLNLTINGSTTSSVSVTECDTYTWNGTTYTSSGSYDYVTVNSNGCDSTATLNLTINGSTTSSVSVTECDTYTWNGTTYTSSGSYDYVTVNSNGCDSTATLNLTINNSIVFTNNQTVCYGGSYTINGNTYNSSGTYTDVLTSSNGCDSTVTTNLTVASQLNVSVQSVGSSTVCPGETVALQMSTYASPANTYQWSDANGAISGATSSTYATTTSGTYTLTVTTPDGCTATSSGFAVTIITVSVPSGLSTSNIQLTKGTMNWSAVANAHHYDIRMREQGSSTWTIAINNISSAATSQQKSNLTSSTTYEWEIRSACSAGTSSISAWSSTQTFTTLTPCTAPLNPVTTSIGLTSASLDWDAVSGAWGYRVRYKQQSAPWSAWTYDTVTTNTYSLSGLANATSYHWQVATMCVASGVNNSGFTSYTVFSTIACNVSLSTSQTNVVCNGGSGGSIDLSVSGGSGSYSYSWSNGETTQDLTSLSAGTYTVTVTDAVCSITETASVTITEPAALNVSVQSVGSSTVCSGETVALQMSTYASPANTYQWSDANGAISGATSSTYATTTSGTYTLTVTTPDGCTATSSGFAVTIVNVSVPSGLSTSNIQLTKGTMNWSAVANAHHYDIRMREQGSSTWTIAINNISSAATSQQKSNLTSSTTYEWEIRSACSAGTSSISAWSSTQTFTTLTPCTAPLNPVTTSIGLTSASLDWDAVSGAWGYRVRYKQQSAPWSAWTYDTVTTNTYSLSGLANATSYHWQVATMCVASGVNNSGFTSYTVFSTIACNVSLSTSQTNVVCNGGSGGSIDLSASGGSGSYSYSWSNGETTQDLTSLSAGTYTVTVTDAVCSITETASVTITEPAALNVSVQSVGSSTVCPGETVALQMSTYASPANTYQWSDANGAISGATSSTYATTTSGTYTLTVTTPDGCTATSSGFAVTIITVSVPSGLSTSNIQLTKGTMNWSAVANAHHYDIRMREQGSSTWTIAINNISSAATSQQKSNLTSSTTYEWEIRSACSAGTSSISAWSSTQTFTTLTPCTAPLNPVTTSIGLTSASLDWDAVSGAWGYRVRYKQQSAPWSAWTYDTVTTNTYSLSGLANATSYHWQVATMCVASGVNNSGFTSYTVFSTIACNVSLSTSQTNVVCNGGSGGSIDLSASGGSGSYSYSWSNGETTQDLTSLSAGTYTVTVTDAVCSITETASVTITEPAALNVSVQSVGSSTVCPGETVALQMSTYASPANTYQWSDANGAISGATSSTYATTTSGTYTLTVTTPDGCTATSSGFAVTIITVSVPSGLSTSNIQLTKGTMNWSAVANAHHYDIRMREQGSSTWTIAINNISSAATSQQKSNLTSSTTYEWEIRSACSAGTSSISAWSSTQTFTTLTPCTAPLNPVTTSIGLTSASLDWDAVSGAWGYRVRYKQQSAPWSAWTYDTVTTNTYSLSGLANATSYHWQVATMCVASGVNNSGFTSYTVFSTIACNVSLSTSQTNVVCNGGSGGSIDLSASGGSGSYSYSWSNGETTQDLTSLSAGTYTVTVTDAVCSITETASVTITEPAALNVSVQSVGSSTVCPGETVVLQMSTYASPANTYQWSDANGAISGATSSTYATTTSGTYTLTVTTPDGCTATSSGFAVTIITVSVPSGLSTSNIQLTKGTMNWSAVANAHHYDIRMREQGSSTWTIAINNISSAATSQQKSNLTSSTTYEWEIRSACSAGTSSISAWSSTQTFTTLTPCTAPLNPVTTSIGLTSASLDWDAVSGAWGYRVRYKQQSAPWSAWTYDTVTTNTYSLSGLANATSYHWQVATMCVASGVNNSGFTSYTVFSTIACNVSLSTSQTNVVCNGGSGGSIDLSASGGSGSYSYSWSNGETTQDLTSLSAGTYTVTVTDAVCSITETASVTITEPAALNVSVQSVGSSTVCPGETVVLQMSTYASPANTYQWSDANGAISGATSSTYATTTSGTYTLTVTTPDGCTATSSGFAVTIITVSVPSGLSTSNIQLTKGTMNWSAVANAHHYDIRMREQGSSTWTIAINNISSAATSQQKSNLTSSTTYEWEIRSACSAGTSSISAWSSTQTFTTLTPCTAPLNPVTTSIGLTSASLDWDAVSGAWGYRVRYKQQSAPWSAWTYDTVTTNTYSLSGLANATSYHWQVATMCVASGVNNSGFTSYTVFSTISCNVSLSTSQTNVVCNGGSGGSIDLSVSGGSGSYSYSWSNGETTQDLTSLSAGTYTVTVTDAVCSITETASVTITEPAALNVSVQSVGSSTVCSGETVALQMSTYASPANTYQWSDANGAISGATSSTYATTTSGTYTLTVTTPDGCTATSSGFAVTIVNVSVPSGLSTSNIQLTKGTMNWSAVANAHHYDIRMREQGSSTWTIAINNISSAATSQQKSNLTSSTTYEWEIRSACSAGTSSISAWSSTQTFTTLTPCTAPLNPVTTSIGLTSASLDWDAVSGAWGYRVRYKQQSAPWSAWTYDTVTTNTYSLSGLANATSYHWQVATMCVASGVNNSGFTSYTVFSTISCNVSLSTSQTNVVCNGGSGGSIDLSVSGGSGSYSYSWSNGETTQDLTSLSAGTYTVTVTDAVCSITETASVTITEPAALNVSVQSVGSSTVCSGETVALQMSTYASPANTYQWSDANGAISGATSSTYATTTSGTYTLTVTTPDGCTATSSGFAVTIVNVSVPSGLSTSNIQLTKGTMNWSAVANAHHYDIRMREQGSSTWTIAINNISSAATSQQKSNLTSSTTYEWEIRSACSAGTSSISAWSSTQTFTTLTPCTAPLNPVTTSIGLTSASLDWDAVSGAWGYRVRYKQQSAPWSAWTYDTVTTNTYSLSGLANATSYHWQVATMCVASGVNNSGFTSYTVFSTISCNVSLSTSQTNVVCNGGSGGSIDLSVSGGSGSYSYSWSNGETTQDLTSLSAGTYTVTVTDAVCSITETASVTITEPAALNVSVQSVGSSTVCSGETVALQMSTYASPANTYQWSDANGAISGATSSTYATTTSGTYTLTVTTPDGCTATSSGFAVTIVNVSVPSGLSTSNIQLTKGTMNWSAVANAHHYDIRMREQGSSTWTIAINNISSAATSQQKSNLTSSTTYEWEIRSACSAGTSSISAWSSTQTLSTLTPCTKPSNTTVTNITSSSAMLGWDAVGGASTTYDVRFKLQGSSWGSWVYTYGVTTNQLSQSGLNPGTYYHWQVRAVCGSSANASGFTSYNTFSTSSNRITAGDVELALNLNVYPNPTDGMFNISFVSEEINSFEITVIDAFGKLISFEDKQNFVGEYTKSVDLSNYPKGIYMVQIKNQHSFVTKRIVLQ